MSMLVSTRLQPLRSSGREAHLDFSPQDLTLVEVVQVIFVFVFRQLLYLLGFGGTVAASTSRDGESFVLPDCRLSMPFRLTRDGLREYALAVGLKDTDTVFDNPAQICLLLSAFSEPAMLLLLASRGCPVRPLGSVNVRNKFEMLVPGSCTEKALLSMENAELRARILTESRRAKRGLEIDLEVQIVHLGEDAVIFRQVFTMLQFMKFKRVQSGPLKEVGSERIEHDWSQAETASFGIAIDAPLAWARICKDYNLLHISSMAAKLSGFPGRIAHGNHALALGIAGLSLEGKNVGYSNGNKGGSVLIDVQFRKPMALPAKLSTQILEKGDTIDFRIIQGDKACVTASMNSRSDS